MRMALQIQNTKISKLEIFLNSVFIGSFQLCLAVRLEPRLHNPMWNYWSPHQVPVPLMGNACQIWRVLGN